MESLGLKELRSALTFLQELYVSRDLSEFQTHLLSTLPKLVPSEICSYNEVNPVVRRNEYTAMPVVPSQYAPVFEKHIGDHPLITHYRKTRDGRALRISDFLSQRQFRQLGLYNEFFRLLRVRYQMAVTLPAPLPLVVGMALSRSQRDFAERDKQLLNLLRPHLAQAYRNAESVTRMRIERAHARQALDELSCGVIGLTRDGRIQSITARAATLLPAYWNGHPRHRDRLPEELARWVRHQTSVTAEAGMVGMPRAPLVMKQDGRNLIVRLIGESDERLLILEEEITGFSPKSLAPLGVTRREAEVLTWMAQGKTNAEIAGILGTSPYTVINHVRHIFDKLGVKTRTAAATRALRAVHISTRGHDVGGLARQE